MKYPMYKGQEVFFEGCTIYSVPYNFYGITVDNFDQLKDTITVMFEDWDIPAVVDIHKCIPVEMNNER